MAPSNQPYSIPIWEIPCTILDSILMLTYETRDLLNLCAQTSVEIEVESFMTSTDAQVFLEIHRHCHRSTVLSRALQSQLNRRYERYIDCVRQITYSDLLELNYRFVQAWSPKHAAGLLWAVATDQREEMRQIEQSQQFHIKTSAFKSLCCQT